MIETSTDRIEKEVVLRAPRSRVWRAITDPREFSKWFGAEMKDEFVPGRLVRGPITRPGYEHLTLELQVERLEPERLFSWRWHPHAVDEKADYSQEPMTLVVFELEEVPEDASPHHRVRLSTASRWRAAPRRSRMNDGGWTAAARQRRPSCGREVAAPRRPRSTTRPRVRRAGRPDAPAAGRPSRPRGPLSIARLTEGAEVTRQAVSKHLRVLQGAGLARGVRLEDASRSGSCSRRRSRMRGARWRRIAQRWDEAIERLRAIVEED